MNWSMFFVNTVVNMFQLTMLNYLANTIYKTKFNRLYAFILAALFMSLTFDNAAFRYNAYTVVIKNLCFIIVYTLLLLMLKLKLKPSLLLVFLFHLIMVVSDILAMFTLKIIDVNISNTDLTSFATGALFSTFYGFSIVYLIKRFKDKAFLKVLFSFLFILIAVGFLNLNLFFYYEKQLDRELLYIIDLLVIVFMLVFIIYTFITSRQLKNKNEELQTAYDQLTKTQEKLIQSERLASLGSLVGGIAHNLKTPVMGISGNIMALKDLTKEYDQSIDNSSVTREDHHEIARDMNNWLEQALMQINYIDKMVTSVKSQAVSFNYTETEEIRLDNVIENIVYLFNTDKNYKLNVKNYLDNGVTLKGSFNSLLQVLSNIITNARDSYNGQPGVIEFNISNESSAVTFIVKDSGSGIPDNVQPKLFKQMITTKGRNGTGIGLYFSYSTIKSQFNGDIRFESAEGEGTTFFVVIPV